MSQEHENALGLIARNYLSMADAEKKIADIVLGNPGSVIHMTVRQLAAQAGISDGSVIRFANQLGFGGYTELKINIARNLSNKEEILYDRLSGDDTPKGALMKTFENAIGALRQTAEFIPDTEMEKAAALLLGVRDRLEFYGVGSSSMVAMDAYYRFMRIGMPAYAVTDAHICSVSASMLTEGCVAVGISHSGSTVETLRAMEIAKGRGAKTLCLTSFSRSPMAQLCDVSLIIASDEAGYNKEAVASRLVQLAVLDALCGYVTVRQADRSIGYMENLVDIIGEHRL